MGEGEQKLCLVEPTLELMENRLLQVQMQLTEKMEDGEALAAEAAAEEKVAQSATNILLIPSQQEMEAAVEQEVMEAVVEAVEREGASFLTALLKEREVREVLAVLEEEVEVAEMLGILAKEIVVVMVQQEVMAEVEGVAGLLVQLLAPVEVVVAVALAVLD